MRRAPGMSLMLVLVSTLMGGTTVMAADPELSSQRPLPAGLDDLRVDPSVGSIEIARPSLMDASLLSATGIRQVVVRLSEASVGEVAASGAGAAAQRRALGAVEAQQERFVGDANATVLGRIQVAVNAVVVEVDAERLAELAADPAVESISPVIDYELALSETVPYIGATTVHTEDGFDGTGVTVAVLDSGIDYTHAAFGGPGTPEAYDAAYGADTGDEANKDQPDWDAIDADTNIVGGFDFVGEVWPEGRLAPDPDPIDCGGKDINPDLGDPDVDCSGGHGTHVADIIGGIIGVAPGVDLHAVKVCSAISSSCSGVALLLGMDYALDPNADGDTADHVDVINMSLGSDYGQAFDDDLSQAVETATEVGVLTVAAAGNGGDKPYVSGTPAAAPSALSVAQTAVPSSTLTLLEVESPPEIAGQYPAVFQSWSQSLEDHGAITSAGFQYATGGATPTNVEGCEPFVAGSLAGLVVLVDRGECDFSLKIANIAAGGAEAGFIGLVDSSDPFIGGLGECPGDLCSSIPGFMISQAAANALKSAEPTPGAVVTLDPNDGLSLVQTIVGSSSRGPTMLTNIIKPEIGAPGGSVSAEVGTATETTAFSGTSGATPMVAGSAALLVEAYADRSPAEIKALLMNYAETEIWNDAPDAPINAPLAAIQRIGAGEVHVDRSVDGNELAAWDSDAPTAALSFGFVDATDASTVLSREVTVHNYGVAEQVLDITPSFRFEDDETNGAVAVDAPATVTVPAGEDATFDVTLTIDGAALRDWTANSGTEGANPTPFNLLEYDGYIDLTSDDTDPLHLPWHVLPRLSGETTVADDEIRIDGDFEGIPAGDTTLTNAGVGPTAIDGYSLVGESPVLASGDEGAGLPTVDLRYVGVQTIPLPAGVVCSANESFLLLLAVNTWERQTHANAPALFEWDIDTDGDGAPDWAVFNLDLAGNLTDGHNVVFVQEIGTTTATPAFFTDHATNSGNTVLTICAEHIGLTGEDIGTPLTADVFAVDVYFTGRVTDVVTEVEFAPLGERYFPVIGDSGFGGGDIAAGAQADLTMLDFGPVGTNPNETGVLLLTDGTRENAEEELFKTGAPQGLEALAVKASVEELPFDDIEGSDFVDDIVWAFENGITTGCSTDPPLFCPQNNVTREQMASFLVRALDLPPTTTDHFDDDESSPHEADINALAEAGITTGCGPDTFCPTNLVLREQMASFLVRGFDLPPTDTDFFDDDESSSHEPDINALAESGITTGCGPDTFCPTSPVTREQMVAFLHRALGD